MEDDNQNGSRDPNAIRGISLAAPCVDTDTSGDVMYTRAVRNEGTVGAGGGGAGVWEQVRGRHRNLLISHRVIWKAGVGVVIADCTWSRA